MSRCVWANNELMITYHDEEWGVPLHDERLLFEFLILGRSGRSQLEHHIEQTAKLQGSLRLF